MDRAHGLCRVDSQSVVERVVRRVVGRVVGTVVEGVMGKKEIPHRERHGREQNAVKYCS